MDISNAKPIGTTCAGCHGHANVLIDGWTPDSPIEERSWTCPRCQAANTLLVPGKVVGVAIATSRVVMGKPMPR